LQNIDGAKMCLNKGRALKKPEPVFVEKNTTITELEMHGFETPFLSPIHGAD